MPRFYENNVLADIFSFFRWDKKQWTICDILKFILGSEAWANKTKETYYLLLSLKMISLFYSSKPRSQVWSLIYRNWSVGFWAKQQLCTCITLFSTFLWRQPHDYDVKPPYATFYGGREHTTTNFLFSFSTWIIIQIYNSNNSTPGKMAGYICQIERVQKDAIEIERMQIHFLATFSLPSSLRCLSSQLSKCERLRGIVSTLFSNHFSKVGAFGLTN